MKKTFLFLHLLPRYSGGSNGSFPAGSSGEMDFGAEFSTGSEHEEEEEMINTSVVSPKSSSSEEIMDTLVN